MDSIYVNADINLNRRQYETLWLQTQLLVGRSGLDNSYIKELEIEGGRSCLKENIDGSPSVPIGRVMRMLQVASTFAKITSLTSWYNFSRLLCKTC